MNFLNPLALLFALLAVPIILLYLLRLQRREQPVSSTLLWRQVIMDREANTLWQKLRRNLLLLLQLATLAFLVFALIRPYVNVTSQLSGKIIVLLDTSASMLATDVAPSRFEAARAEVRKLIDQLGNNDQMTLIAVDGTPRILSTTTNDASQLRASLEGAAPTLTTANWSSAISLAAGLGGDGATTIVISDGANAEDVQLLQGVARYIPIGSSGDNIAISTLSLRRTVRGVSAFVRVSNTGAQNDSVLVSLKADGNLIDARTLAVPAGQSATWTINAIDPTITTLQATIDQAQHNALTADDQAYAVNVNNTTRRALLLTRGNRFLEQAMSVLPNLRTTRAVAMPPASEQNYDLYVLDNMTTTLPANANALIIGAQSVFSTSGTFSNTAYVRTETNPIVQNLDWRTINILDIQRVNAPQNLRPIVFTQGGPALFVGENVPMRNLTQLQRVAVLPFELRRSDLPLQIAFPILIANVVDYLAPPQGFNVPSNVRPGEIVPLPEGAVVQPPGQSPVAVGAQGFADTGRAGIYGFRLSGAEVNGPAGNGPAGSGDENPGIGAFAVNFLNPTESAITPNPQLQVGNATTNAAAQTQLTQRELWNILAVLALLLLIVEWWIYQRGVPARLATLGQRPESPAPPPTAKANPTGTMPS